ncbi:unnamed protein product [Pylaiella littoralis]
MNCAIFDVVCVTSHRVVNETRGNVWIFRNLGLFIYLSSLSLVERHCCTGMASFLCPRHA